MMEVKGESLKALGTFVREGWGEAGVGRWVDSMSPEGKRVHTSQILVGSWYPLKAAFSEPIARLCDLFHQGEARGAWDSGRFGAEHGLKGVFEMFVDSASPEVLIQRGSLLIGAYYRPSPHVEIESMKGSGVMRMTQFPELDRLLEIHIGGWIERALELSGCRDVVLKITRSIPGGDPHAEYCASWK